MNIVERDEEVKRVILEAARRVFRKWGMNKTTMEDIAQEAGKGKSTLYNYYESKDEIFETLAMEELANILKISKAAVGAVGSAKEKLRAYIATVMVEIKKTAGVHPLLLGELKGKKEFVRRVMRQMDKFEETLVMDILDEGIRSGEFKGLNDTNKRKAASVVVGIVRGLELYFFLEIDDQEKLDLATTLIANGI